VSTVNRILPAVLLLKSIDVMGSATVVFEQQWWAALLTAGLVVSALVWWRSPRPGAAMAAVVLLVLAAGPLYRNHVAFLAWVAALTAFSRDEQEHRLLLTVHLSVVYAFATFVKLSPVWLSGEALAARSVVDFGVPLVVLAWATVLVEGVLAVAVWWPSRRWLVLAAATHVSFVIGMGENWLESLRLTVFNVAILAIWVTLVEARERAPDVPVLAPLSQRRVPAV
jgi:hypothetical protein